MSAVSGPVGARERLRAIRLHLAEKGELGLEEAARLYGGSVATVRRAFARLAGAGEAERTWGGLKPVGAGAAMVPFAERAARLAREKAGIARAAASLLREGDVVMIDGGTTTLHLAPLVAPRRVRVVTNSLAVAHRIDVERRGRAGAEVFLTGGQLFPESGLLTGLQARAALRGWSAAWVFLSCAGVDAAGATNSNESVVEVEREMIARADRVALLADHTKIGKVSFARLCAWAEVDVVVTDRPVADAAVREAIGAAGTVVVRGREGGVERRAGA